jgi:hypothetical protein
MKNIYIILYVFVLAGRLKIIQPTAYKLLVYIVLEMGLFVEYTLKGQERNIFRNNITLGAA